MQVAKIYIPENSELIKCSRERLRAQITLENIGKDIQSIKHMAKLPDICPKRFTEYCYKRKAELKTELAEVYPLILKFHSLYMTQYKHIKAKVLAL